MTLKIKVGDQNNFQKEECMIYDRIPYEMLVQGALRNVIRQVLENVATDGLPGEHHFYITFHTNMAGVEMSARLKERYPDHVTIVLQNQFWDLAVGEEYFSVTLSFSDVPERLVVPFMAIQAFYDPVASFEASFDIAPQIASSPSPESLPVATVFVPKNAKDNKQHGKQIHDKIADKSQNRSQENITSQGADVVSLDAFRKK